MKLILSRFDPIKKIIIIYAVPNQNVPDMIYDELVRIYDKFSDQNIGDDKIHYDDGPCLSILFNIKSAWYPDIQETMVLTLYFKEHENIHFFENLLMEAVEELEKILELSKVLYIATPHADKNSFKLLGQVVQILSRTFFGANKLYSTYNIGLAEILVLGAKQGGKSSIVDHLIHGKFMPQTAPTLTPKILTLFFEQMDFRVLDACCDVHIKTVIDDHPIEPGMLPQAIVYVVDASIPEEEQDSTVKSLADWIEYFKIQYPPSDFEKLPILIVFNKTDLNPVFDIRKYEGLYKSTTSGLNVRFGAISAKTGVGLDENFGWLLKRISITQKS